MTAFLRRFWPAIPSLILLAWLIFTRMQLADAQADLRTEKAERKTDAAIGERDRALAEAGYAGRLVTATTGYAERIATREPIILRSTDTVRTYAETPAGRVLCLPADRVSGIDGFDRELFAAPAGAPSDGAGALPTDAGSPAD